MNFSIYNKDTNGNYLSVNDEFQRFATNKNLNEIIGVDDRALPWARSSKQIMRNDQEVIKTRTSKIFIEKAQFKNQRYIRRCFKSPIYGLTGKIIGLSGVSISVDPRILIPLSKQQTACIQELALGGSNKSIAKKLGLSPRTVEHYLEATKQKLNCETRSELVVQAVIRGLVGVSSPS